MKTPKIPDPIRAMSNQSCFNIDTIFSMPIKILLKELLDRSNITIKEIAYAMQRAIPQYHVRRTLKAKVVEEEPSIASLVLAASV